MNPKSEIILGIDPGTSRIGYAFLKKEKDKIKALNWGCLELASLKTQAQKLQAIHKNLEEFIRIQKPNLLAIEKIFFAKNAKTALDIAEARGVIINLAQEKNLEIMEFTPLEVKAALSGYGRAQKEQIQKLVKIILNLKDIPKPDDAADAIAVALAACYTNTILK